VVAEEARVRREGRQVGREREEGLVAPRVEVALDARDEVRELDRPIGPHVEGDGHQGALSRRRRSRWG